MVVQPNSVLAQALLDLTGTSFVALSKAQKQALATAVGHIEISATNRPPKIGDVSQDIKKIEGAQRRVEQAIEQLVDVPQRSDFAGLSFGPKQTIAALEVQRSSLDRQVVYLKNIRDARKTKPSPSQTTTVFVALEAFFRWSGADRAQSEIGIKRRDDWANTLVLTRDNDGHFLGEAAIFLDRCAALAPSLFPADSARTQRAVKDFLEQEKLH